MWLNGWRNQAWDQFDQVWDILIIGGGITGAGIFRRAVQEGYKVLLVEAADFSSGTSSRSSKLIHGGIRYLRNKQYKMTRESVREREWLLKEAKHLVTPLPFVMPYPDDKEIERLFGLGVVIYDLLAPKWQHRKLSLTELLQGYPLLANGRLKGAYVYNDAAMDDSAVVVRLLSEAVAMGGLAVNYTRASNLLFNAKDQVNGAVLTDLSSFNLPEKEVRAKVVINATGPWSDELRAAVDAPARLRKQRGSHVVFSRERLNLTHAVSLLHPRDHRAMFAIPWEGVTIIGTTDLDHRSPFSAGEPYATQEEIDYILQVTNAYFPSAEVNLTDIISTFAGVRPIITSGHADPSKESRGHMVWEENGLITITGGKYTTFRLMAEAALQQAMPRLPHPSDQAKRKCYFAKLSNGVTHPNLQDSRFNYLHGRYGSETAELLANTNPAELQPIHQLPNTWSEVRWAARTGAVEHLDDLLLRRVRLGLLLPDGARADMETIRALAQPELGWSDTRWQTEVTRYFDIYAKFYSPAPAGY